MLFSSQQRGEANWGCFSKGVIQGHEEALAQVKPLMGEPNMSSNQGFRIKHFTCAQPRVIITCPIDGPLSLIDEAGHAYRFAKQVWASRFVLKTAAVMEVVPVVTLKHWT